MGVHFRFWEAVYTILAACGALTALAADRLGMESLKEGGLALFFLGIIVFGLDMVVQRRAEIGTRYSSSVNPSFHVFRGPGAVAWGVVFVVSGLLVVGYAFISLTNWSSAREFFGKHTSVWVIFAGIVVTAWGFGSATKARYRYRDTERPARRLADRVAAIALIIPIGLTLLGWGLLKTFAAPVAEDITLTLKTTALRWLETLLN